MERIDRNTWRTDNGDEVRAQGLTVTVELGERTKAEVLCAVEAVRTENDKLRELVRDLRLQLSNAYDNKELVEYDERLKELGIEVDDGDGI